MKFPYDYIRTMKWATAMLLFVLVFTVLTPLSPTSLILSADRSENAYVNLDVCHSAAPAFSSDGEMPFLNMTITSYQPAFLRVSGDPAGPLFTELILAYRSEQPPRS